MLLNSGTYTLQFPYHGDVKAPEALLKAFSSKFQDLDGNITKTTFPWTDIVSSTVIRPDDYQATSFYCFKFFVYWLYTARFPENYCLVSLPNLWIFGEELGARLFQNAVLHWYTEHHKYFRVRAEHDSEDEEDSDLGDEEGGDFEDDGHEIPFDETLFDQLQVNGEIPPKHSPLFEFVADALAFRGTGITCARVMNQDGPMAEAVKQACGNGLEAPWYGDNISKYLL